MRHFARALSWVPCHWRRVVAVLLLWPVVASLPGQETPPPKIEIKPMVGERFPMTRGESFEVGEEKNWTLADADYAYNEMYARHGFDFGGGPAQQTFARFDWYREQLKPGVSQLSIDTILSDTESRNVGALTTLRDSLRDAQNRAGHPRELPVLQANLFIDYHYSLTPPGAGKKAARAKSAEISVTERVALPNSSLVNTGGEAAQVIDVTGKIVPVRFVVRLSFPKGKQKLVVEARDRSGKSVLVADDEPATPETDANEEDGERMGLSWGQGLDLPAAILRQLNKTIKQWTERDEGGPCGAVTLDGVLLMVGPASEELQQHGPREAETGALAPVAPLN